MKYLILFGFLSLAPLSAQADPLLLLMDALRENGTLTEQQYQRIANAITKAEIQQDEAPHVATKGGVSVTKYSGEHSFNFRGQIDIDAGGFNEDQVTLGDGTNLRRAKIGAEGKIAEDWEYELEVDFADGDVDLDDAFLTWTADSENSVRIGQFKEPFSMEEITSSRKLTFMERSVANELAPGRNLGIVGSHVGQNFAATLGIFGEDFNDDADDEGDEGWAVTGRLRAFDKPNDTRGRHVALALSHRAMNGEEEVRFRTEPETRLTDVEFLDTGKIKYTRAIQLAGLEGGITHGPLNVQAEAMHVRVDRIDGMPDAEFGGGYIQGSWVLTGESREYKHRQGTFGRVKPNSRSGAWEIAARASRLDLTHGAIRGGEERLFSLGVNWYLNSQLRLMANWIHVDNDNDANQDGDVAGGDNPDILQMRLQAEFE